MMKVTERFEDKIRGELKDCGLQPKRVFYNPSYDHLIDWATTKETRYPAVMTAEGSLAVDTGRFTGRCPKDKYIVKVAPWDDRIWWADDALSGSDNQPLPETTWRHLHDLCRRQLNGATPLWVMDGFCGARERHRIGVRLITPVVWAAHFFKNMFLRPSEHELEDFPMDWMVWHAPEALCTDHQRWGLHSPVFIVFHFEKRMILIGGTAYSGEIKKGLFNVMNALLPLKGVASLHCSANASPEGETALFFGLSGTGKTTLSSVPGRRLIGDDEHGWDEEGIFNLEGGCYAKCIGLTEEREPLIFRAVRRGALLENVVVRNDGRVDFQSAAKTENTRVSYPLSFIPDAVDPPVGGHPKVIFFLVCDAFGVLPPISVLTPQQAMYHFLMGYTSKVAGTEMGVTVPQPVFSTCFAQPFLTLPPTVYADLFEKQIKTHDTRVFLMNTGWIGGRVGRGRRIPLEWNRKMVEDILDGRPPSGSWGILPRFNLRYPCSWGPWDRSHLDPRALWPDAAAYDTALNELADLFKQQQRRWASPSIGRTAVAEGAGVSD